MIRVLIANDKILEYSPAAIHMKSLQLPLLLREKMFTIKNLRAFGSQVRRMSSNVENPVVELPGLGRLRGSTTQSAWTNRRIYQFLGVKYAEAPIGELRFKVFS